MSKQEICLQIIVLVTCGECPCPVFFLFFLFCHFFSLTNEYHLSYLRLGVVLSWREKDNWQDCDWFVFLWLRFAHFFVIGSVLRLHGLLRLVPKIVISSEVAITVMLFFAVTSSQVYIAVTSLFLQLPLKCWVYLLT